MTAHAPNRSRPFYGWTVAAVCGVGLALGIATIVAATFSIFMTPIRTELGFSQSEMFRAPLVVTLATVFSAPLIGALVDRIGARRVILASFVLEALILASFYYLDGSLLAFYARYLLLGVLAIGTTHVAFARVIALWFDRRRGLALGLALAGVGVGGIVMPPLCQALIENFGWRLAYVILAGIILVLALSLVGLLLRDSPQSMGLRPDGVPADSRDVTRDGAPPVLAGLTLNAARTSGFYWLMLLTFFVVGVSLQAMMLHLVPLLLSRGVSAPLAATAQSTIFAGLLVGRLVTGWLMDRFFAPRVALAFLMAPVLGMAMLALGADGPLAFVAAAGIGLAAGAEVDVIAYLTSRYFGMLQFSRVYGTFYALYSLGGGVGPLLTAEGVERFGGYGPVLWLHVLALLGAALALAFFPRFPRWSAPAAPAALALIVGSAGLMLLAAPAAAAQPAPPPRPAAYHAALAAAAIPPRLASVVVTPLDGGSIALAENASLATSPASTMKLVTTYAALLALGREHVWTTEAYALAPLTADGVLDGALAIRGSGDPTLVIERFWLLVQRIRGFGVREIRGDLVLDRSAFEPMAHDPEQFDGAESRAYNAGPDALLVNFKALTFEFVPDPASGTARVLVTPRLAGARVPPSVRGAAGPCGDWRSRLRGELSDPLAPRFTGEYPLACGTRAWHLNALDPSAYFAAVFRELWQAAGGSWSGRVREGPVPPGARHVATLESRPLVDAVRDINKFSNNVMARQLFLTLGAVASAAPANTARGAEAVRAALAARGLSFPELVLENGSGLSRRERIAPASLAALLVDAWRSPLHSELMSSLPVAGVDGTLRGRRVAPGHAHLKTGLLADVRALAGYVQAASGRRYVLVAIVNGPRAPAAQAAHDALIEWIHRQG